MSVQPPEPDPPVEEDEGAPFDPDLYEVDYWLTYGDDDE